MSLLIQSFIVVVFVLPINIVSLYFFISKKPKKNIAILITTVLYTSLAAAYIFYKHG